MRPKTLQRRQFLRATGVSIGLPFFASLGSQPAALGAASYTASSRNRMVCIGNMLGFYPDAFWPTPGKDAPDRDASVKNAVTKNNVGTKDLVEHQSFSLGKTTASLNPLRDQFTIISGLDHGLTGGHFSIHAFLSGVRQIDARSMPMANVTVDQFAADFIPGVTRFPTLTIGSETGIHGGCQLSWTRSGTRVPPIPGPQQLFQKLFVGTNENDKAAAANRFQMQSSILDMVQGNATDMRRKLNQHDKDKLDEYLTSVRDVEKRIDLRRNWIDVPHPDAPFKRPANRNLVEDLPMLYDLIVLALQTDSTRIATLEIGGDFNPQDLGVKGGYHAFSHHGKRQASIDALMILENYQVEQFARFVSKLAETEDENGSLLDQTSVLFGSGMGNANSHTNTNLPVVLAGGGFRHGRMLAFNQKSQYRPPLTNLFVSMLQNFGAETDKFANSTGTLRGLS